MPTVFISYNRHSQAFAGNLVIDIQALGYVAWFDQRLFFGSRIIRHPPVQAPPGSAAASARSAFILFGECYPQAGSGIGPYL